MALTVRPLSRQTQWNERAAYRAAVAHAAGAPGRRPHELLPGRGRASAGAPGLRRAHTDRGAGVPAPVITFQCIWLRGPEETPSATQRERRALPRDPRRAGAGGRGARGVQRRARNADAPASPAPSPRPPRPRGPVQGLPGLCAHLLRRKAAEASGAALGLTAHLPGPRPRPHRRRQHRGQRRLTCRAVPLRSASPQRLSHRYPTSIFSRFKENRISCFSRSGSAAPSPAAARGPGASPPPPPPALRSAPRAPPLRPRPRAPPDVTGRSRAPPPSRVDVRAPRPRPAGRLRARVLAATTRAESRTPGRVRGTPRSRTRARGSSSRCPLAPASGTAGDAA